MDGFSHTLAVCVLLLMRVTYAWLFTEHTHTQAKKSTTVHIVAIFNPTTSKFEFYNKALQRPNLGLCVSTPAIVYIKTCFEKGVSLIHCWTIGLTMNGNKVILLFEWLSFVASPLISNPNENWINLPRINPMSYMSLLHSYNEQTLQPSIRLQNLQCIHFQRERALDYLTTYLKLDEFSIFISVLQASRMFCANLSQEVWRKSNLKYKKPKQCVVC